MANEWGKNPREHGKSSGTNEDNRGAGYQEWGIPPGFRFCPTDKELIEYLTCKLKGLHYPNHKHIEEVDIYAYSPMQLSEMYKLDHANEWYFFTPRSKKYPNGERPDRFAKDGYWKPTANGKAVRDEGKKMGNVRTLSFRIGFEKDKTDQKSEWLMHEYTLDRDPKAPTPISDKTLDKCVLVKIYRKRGASNVADIPEKGRKNGMKEIGPRPPTFDDQEHHNIMPYPTTQQFHPQPSQIVEGLQNLSFFGTPRPLQAIEPPHPSPLGRFIDTGLQNNPNFGFNVAFSGSENQQIPPPPQMCRANGAGSVIPVPVPVHDGQFNGLLTFRPSGTTPADPHFDGQFYGQRTFGLNGTLTGAPHLDGQLYPPQTFGLNGTEIAAPPQPAGQCNDAEDQNFSVCQLNIDGPNANLANLANNNQEDHLAWLDDEWLDFNPADIDISGDVLTSVADFDGDFGCFSYPHLTLP